VWGGVGEEERREIRRQRRRVPSSPALSLVESRARDDHLMGVG
jgi:hypothetical protein